MPRVVLYLRVSSDDQTTTNQVPDLTMYAKHRGWKIVEKYIDEGITGSKESRPALDRLREDAKDGKFTAVLCWKFDRISRNTRHLLTLHEELSKSNVFLVSVTEGIDATTASGKFVMTVMAGVAELERATLIERTKAGIRRARAEGKQIGRTPQFSVDDNKIAELLAAGKNAYQIMKQLGVPRTTIYRKVAALKAVATEAGLGFDIARPSQLDEIQRDEATASQEPLEVAAAYTASDEDLPAVFWEAR